MYGQNLKLLVESQGERQVEETLRNMARGKKIKLAGSHFGQGEEIHLSELYEAFVGLEHLSVAQKAMGYVEMPLAEDLKVSMFSNITGELISNMVIEAYQYNAGVADALCSTYKTKYRDERMAGFGASEDPKEVKEGNAYEDSGLSEKYITLGTAVKKGRIISITEECIYYDQTSQIIKRAEGIGEKCALDKEKVLLRIILGVTNAYYPSGVNTALYGAAPYLVASNPLTDWTSIETCLLTGFAAMKDENDEIINVKPTTLLVPSALLFTAKRTVNATEILGKTPTSGTAGTTAQARETKSANVVDNYQIVSSHQVSALQSSNGDTNWWLGDFKKQFYWKEIWPLQTFKETPNGVVQFEKDVVTRFKVRYFGNGFVMDNRYVVKNKAGA